MARYIGPKQKISRRFGVAIFGSSRSLEKRNYPPGQHGVRSGRRKKSEYSVALAEKQKLRFQYGLLERQFRRTFAKAQSQRGVTGELLLQMLETRLDSVAYRMGLGNTRNAARQLVNHGHVSVNGKRCDIPSYHCKPGDVLSVRSNPKSHQLALRALDLTQSIPMPDWLTMDRDKMVGKVMRVPTREEISPIVNEQLVVELYSR